MVTDQVWQHTKMGCTVITSLYHMVLRSVCPVIRVTAGFCGNSEEKETQECLTQAQIPKSPTSTQKFQIHFCWPMTIFFEKKNGSRVFAPSLLPPLARSPSQWLRWCCSISKRCFNSCTSPREGNGIPNQNGRGNFRNGSPWPPFWLFYGLVSEPPFL